MPKITDTPPDNIVNELVDLRSSLDTYNPPLISLGKIKLELFNQLFPEKK